MFDPRAPHSRGLTALPRFEQQANTRETNKAIPSPNAILETTIHAPPQSKSAQACLTFRTNNPNPERCAPRVCKPGHPPISTRICLSCRLFGCCGQVPTFPASRSCLPGVLCSGYQDVVGGGGVLDLDLGAQLVELEVGFQTLRDGKRAIQQIALGGVWESREKEERIVLFGLCRSSACCCWALEREANKLRKPCCLLSVPFTTRRMWCSQGIIQIRHIAPPSATYVLATKHTRLFCVLTGLRLASSRGLLVTNASPRTRPCHCTPHVEGGRKACQDHAPR